MIRIVIDSKGRDPASDTITVEATGSIFEIASELGVAIGDLYHGMLKTDPGMAKSFKLLMQATVADRAPTWSMELPMTPGSTSFRAVVPRWPK